MRRRTFLAAVATAACAPVLGILAQGPVRRVAILGFTESFDSATLEVLVERLTRDGFVGGRNLEVFRGRVGGDADRNAEAVRGLLRMKPDVIYATGAEPAVDAIRALDVKVPTVFVSVTDPVARGYVRELARPGTNLTGVTDRYVELGVKRLEMLRETLPGARRVAFFGHFDDTLGFTPWRAAAQRLGFDVIDVDLSRPGLEFAAALELLRSSGSQCLFPIGPIQGLVNPQMPRVKAFVDFAARHRLPAIFSSTGVVTLLGGLMSLQVDDGEIRRLGADMVARILQGERPETMPVREPDRYVVAVNLATAKAQGIEFPRSVLLRATEVVR